MPVGEFYFEPRSGIYYRDAGVPEGEPEPYYVAGPHFKVLFENARQGESGGTVTLSDKVAEIRKSVKEAIEFRRFPGMEVAFSERTFWQGLYNRYRSAREWRWQYEVSRVQLFAKSNRAHAYMGVYPYGTSVLLTMNSFVNTALWRQEWEQSWHLEGCLFKKRVKNVWYKNDHGWPTSYDWDDCQALAEAAYNALLEVADAVVSKYKLKPIKDRDMIVESRQVM